MAIIILVLSVGSNKLYQCLTVCSSVCPVSVGMNV